MTPKEFFELKQRLEGLDYFGNTDDRHFFHKTLVHHISQAPVQRKVNINSYFKDGDNRLKMIEALNYLKGSDSIKGKRLYFEDGLWWVDELYVLG